MQAGNLFRYLRLPSSIASVNMAAMIEELWAEPEEISPDPADAGLVDLMALARRSVAVAAGVSGVSLIKTV